MTIYVVTAGEYSAYCVCAMFSNEELAQKYISDHHDPESKERTYEFNDIEEYVLDGEYDIPKWVNLYETHFNAATGDLNEEFVRRVLFNPHQREFSHTNLYCHWQKRERQGCTIGQSFVSAETARKLAIEARQKYLREKE